MALPAMPPLDRVCRGGIDVLGRDTCAVVLMSNDEAGSLAASCGPHTGVAADLQFALGEGPCLTSFREGISVFEPNLAHDARWPVFAAAAVAEGVRAVTVLPMCVGGIRLGVLYLGDGAVGDIDGDALADAYELAKLATLVVLDRQHDRNMLDGATENDEWSGRAVVHQATGMVSAQLEVPLDDALARLRATAFANGRPIYELAADVVDRRIRLAKDSGEMA
jgi:GAF domain-containing protein